jgi:hypothetical protein
MGKSARNPRDLGCHPGCQFCAVVTTSAARNEAIDDAVLAHVGSDVLILVRRETREVLVASTDHIATLAALPAAKMGALLAALRRVATVVQSREGRVTIEPVKELVDPEGHLSFRVGSRPPETGPTPFADFDGLVRRLSEVLS